MTAPKKFNIRITFAPQRSEVTPKTTDYIYHWHRIIAATLLLMITLTASIYGGYAYFHKANSLQANVEAKIASALSKNLIPEKTDSKVNVITTKNTHENKLPLAAADKDEITAMQSNNSAALFRQSAIQIFSKNIQRFVIAPRIQNREPLGSIGDIKFDANNIATVYAFSQAVGLVNETLYYKWRLNGKDIATVRLKIGADRWRSYSTKFIQPQMHGDWSVSLEDNKGEILAVSRFQY